MKQIIFIAFSLFIIISCTGRKNTTSESEELIRVDKYQDTEIELTDMVSDIQFLVIRPNDESPIGAVSDLCIIKDTVYIWDNITSSVFSFDVHTGAFIRTVRYAGNGPNEYINPMGITGDSGHVYLLDMPTNRIICLDRELNQSHTIHIPVPSSKFISLENGFLLNNLNKESHANKWLHIDSTGAIKEGFLPFETNDRVGVLSSTGKTLTKTSDGNVYFAESGINKIYSLSDGKVVPKYTLDFLNHSIPNDVDFDRINLFEMPYAFGIDYFQLNSMFVFSFFKEMNRYYGFYDLNKKTLKAGKVSDKMHDLPFFPQWQYGDYLIGACPFELLLPHINTHLTRIMNKNKRDYEMEDMVLLFYSMSDKSS
jgi:hypothetical protein